jgi:hypothetical protein
MKKGRKAEPGTHEARDYINNGSMLAAINLLPGLSTEAKARSFKAVCFGLGVPLPTQLAAEIDAKIASIQGGEDEEYFAPDRCRDVQY